MSCFNVYYSLPTSNRFLIWKFIFWKTVFQLFNFSLKREIKFNFIFLKYSNRKFLCEPYGKAISAKTLVCQVSLFIQKIFLAPFTSESFNCLKSSEKFFSFPLLSVSVVLLLSMKFTKFHQQFNFYLKIVSEGRFFVIKLGGRKFCL